MSDKGLSLEELQAECAIALPDKEVVSILDLNADVDILIDTASPIDLAAAANLNVAAPISAAASANVLTDPAVDANGVVIGAPDGNGSGAQATVLQVSTITQDVSGDAWAEAAQDSGIDQADTTGTLGDTGGTGTVGDTTGTVGDPAAGAVSQLVDTSTPSTETC